MTGTLVGRLMLLTFLVWLLCVPPVLAQHQVAGLELQTLVFGIEACVWEASTRNHYTYFPQIHDAETCEQVNMEYETVYIGESFGVFYVMTKPPTTPCECGDHVYHVWFNPEMEEEGLPSCNAVKFSCTRPDSGCRWMRFGVESVDLGDYTETEDCREHARRCGHPYVGLDGSQLAAELPTGDCMCGESVTKWFLEGLTCQGYVYKCLKVVPRHSIVPGRLIRDIPRGVTAP